MTRPPSPSRADPTAGRPIEQWLRSYDSRTARLTRLIELNAPGFLISNEVELIRQALAAIDALRGDPDRRTVGVRLEDVS